jgi:hypothetical protein
VALEERSGATVGHSQAAVLRDNKHILFVVGQGSCPWIAAIARLTMSKDWLENLESHLPSSIEHAVKDADKAVHDLVEHVHLSHWHPISTAPCNQELELRISGDGNIVTLNFPCLQTNSGAWINVDLGSQIEFQAVEWRVWQRKKSPDPHHSMIKPSDRSALLHHDPGIPKRDTNAEDQE